MELSIFYILMFCIGLLFGSFFTLAIYRIPLHQDITHKRSYCPNCNHKLSFFDMIPIFSYLFLKGRCRYCKTKIRIRYLLLEILTGILFLLWAISLNINIFYIETSKWVYLVVGFLYLAGIMIIAGIDKEKRAISKPIILYEIILLSLYMIYLYIVEKANIYRYVIYLFVICVFLIMNHIYYKKHLKDNYPIYIFILSIIMCFFTNEIGYILTAILTLFMIAIVMILYFVRNVVKKHIKNEIKYSERLPIAFYLCCSNIIILLFINFIACRWMI